MLLRTKVFELYSGYYGNLSQLARAMSISVSQVSRVRNGKRNINQQFIIGALSAVPQFSFNELFYLAQDFDSFVTEKALWESEDRYRAIFEQAADSVLLVDAQTGAVVECNDKAHETLGYTREEFKKLKIPDVEIIESAEEIANHIEKVVKEGADTFETKHRTKGGEILDVEVRCRAISTGERDFIQCIWHDITERKRAEEKLRASEAKYRRLVEDINDGYLVTKRGVIVFANAKIGEMLGYEVKELIGEDGAKFTPPEFIPSLQKLRRRLAQQREVPERVEGAFLNRKGERVPIEMSMTVIDYEGEPANAIIVRDITERKRA